MELTVFYGHRATQTDQARAGFGTEFQWDVDLLSGYAYEFIPNRAHRPGLDHFAGVDTPNIGTRLRNFDAVILMGWFLKCFHQALWAAKLRNIPVMVRGDSHLDTPRSAWKRFAKEMSYPIFLRLFDGALAVGQRNREYWRHYHYPEQRIFDAPHCVDNNWFASRATESASVCIRRKLGIGQDAKVVLFAGKLIALKRPLDVITAASLLKARGCGVEVLIAGSGPLEQQLKDAAHSAGVRLHMLGFCNQSEMPGIYAVSDVLVMPSESETWGLVANEALACSKPVVLSDSVGCAPDMFAIFGDRIVFPTGNADALANCLQDIFTCPIDREQIARAAARFSLGAACDGVQRAVETVSQQRSSIA